MRVLILQLILVQSAIAAYGQSRPEINLEQFAEERFQLQDADVDYASLYESLLMYYSSPLDLNKADYEELSSLYLLSPGQLKAFFDYRDQFGTFISLFELQAIPEFDEQTIHQLLPFVVVNPRLDPRPLLERLMHEKNNYLLLRYSKTFQRTGSQPDRNTKYLGNPGMLYGRFRVHHPHDFSLGFTFEKDAGESFRWNPNGNQYGFDFYSGHLLLKNQGLFETIALGDFQLQFGQGLVFGSGFRTGKGAEPINTVMQNTLGIRPYTSALESGFFRGAATTLKAGKMKGTVFISHNRQDAKIINDSMGEYDAYVSGVRSSGYHRTHNELLAKDNFSEMNIGVGLSYKVSKKLRVGFTGLGNHFSLPIQKNANKYNQFEFSGDQNWVTSVFGNYHWQNLMLFGEAALSKSGGKGGIAGFISSLAPHLDFSWVIRHYEKDFHSLYSSAFGENSRTINEKGMYWGLKYRPSGRFELSAYFDRFSFPWLKYRVEAPSRGLEYLARATYKPARPIVLYVQYREERKEISQTENDGPLKPLLPTYKQNLLFNLDYQLNQLVQLKTKIQGSRYRETTEVSNGIAIVQDVNVSLGKVKLSTRFALFDSEDYPNRQYVYERDVLYSFSIPAYYGTGMRTYLMVSCKATKKISIYARYARFGYINDVPETVNPSRFGKTQSQLKVMLKLSL